MRTLAIMVMGGDNCANNALVHSIVKYVNSESVKTAPQVITLHHGVGGVYKRKSTPILPAEIEPRNPSYQWGVSREPLCFPTAEKFIDYVANTGTKRYFDDAKKMKELPPESRSELLTRINHQRVSEIVEILAHDLHATDLVIIGGDGTQRAVQQFCEIYDRLDPKLNEFQKDKGYELNIISVPSTMDNNFNTMTLHDTIKTSVCPGYSSALVETIRDTQAMIPVCKSGNRVMFIETMGGLNTGWVTAATAVGGAQISIFNEMINDPLNSDPKKFSGKLFDLIEDYLKISGYAMIGMFEPTECPEFIISEENKDDLDKGIWKYVARDYSSSGSRSVGAGLAYQRLILDHFKNRASEPMFIYTSYQNLGYLAKAGPVSEYDLELSDVIGQRVAHMIENRVTRKFPALGEVVGIDGLSVDKIKEHDIKSIQENTPLSVPKEYLSPSNLTVTDAYLEFVNMLISRKKR